MSSGEMLEMVDILKKADYDGKYGPYPNPNIRKAKIIAKVVRSLHRNFGYDDRKISSGSGEKRLGGHPSSEETTDPPPLEEGEIPPTQVEQEEEEDVVEIDTTGDREVRDRDPFTSESAQILIGEIMGCNLELENIKKKIIDVIQKNNNIIDVLGRI
ncbi:hypothetical protein AB205_0153010 [Aquarana catesbeiana]|uniref:Uncharacterized protein n=1 Tax=Aquarana catesbeiana TaxID=8400 RepID=A0A2G9Q683_AQUCT|nr:hypothetical protein AB205_0153010 [Aquarana catesbeiana]